MVWQEISHCLSSSSSLTVHHCHWLHTSPAHHNIKWGDLVSKSLMRWKISGPPPQLKCNNNNPIMYNVWWLSGYYQTNLVQHYEDSKSQVKGPECRLVTWWHSPLHDEEEDNGPISVSDQAKVSLDMWSWGHGCILFKQIFIFLFSVQINIAFIYQNPWFD